MNLLASLFNQYRKFKYVNSFISATKDPMKAQENLLLNIINKNKDTVFGKEHNFASVKTVENYRRNVPVMDYEGFHPYIERIKNGERNVLTGDEIVYFAITTGTTGQPKFCPMTKYAIKSYTENFQRLFYFAYKEHKGMFNGFIVGLVGKPIMNYTKSIPYGETSGMIYHNEPFFVKYFYAIPEEVFEINDYDSKFYCILRFSIEKDVSSIIIPNPFVIIHLCLLASKYANLIIDDIMNGTISQEFKVEPEIRGILSGKLRKNPERAANLKKLLLNNQLVPKYYWPNLKLICCWKEGTVSHYFGQLREFFENVPIMDLGLIGSEGFDTIPYSDHINGGIPALDTTFFEFRNVKDEKIYSINNLRIGESYALILTTNSGFFRYNLNDVVKIIDYFNQTPVFQFIHRGNNIVSVDDEKFTENQVVNAIRIAQFKFKVPIHHYIFYAHLGANGHYDIFIELYKPANKSILKSFLEAIDTNLKILNFDYKDRRNENIIKSPKLKIIKKDSFSELHKNKSRGKGNEAQIKLPILTDDKNLVKNFHILYEILL